MQTLTPPNTDEDMKQQEHTFIACRNANGTATLEDNQAVPYKTKHTLTNGPAIEFLSTNKKN